MSLRKFFSYEDLMDNLESRLPILRFIMCTTLSVSIPKLPRLSALKAIGLDGQNRNRKRRALNPNFRFKVCL